MKYDWDPIVPRIIHDTRALLRQIATRTSMLELRLKQNASDPAIKELIAGATGAQKQLDLFLQRTSAFRDAVNSKASEKLPLDLVVKSAKMARTIQLANASAKLEAHNLTKTPAPASLQNVLEELVDNSLLFCNEKSAPEIEIEARVTNETLQITYRDNSSGWDQRFTEKIFLPYERLDSRGKFGLGLAIAKALVEAERGSIVASTHSTGSAFVIETPLA